MNILKNWQSKLLFGYYNYPAEEGTEMEEDIYAD